LTHPIETFCTTNEFEEARLGAPLPGGFLFFNTAQVPYGAGPSFFLTETKPFPASMKMPHTFNRVWHLCYEHEFTARRLFTFCLEVIDLRGHFPGRGYRYMEIFMDQEVIPRPRPDHAKVIYKSGCVSQLSIILILGQSRRTVYIPGDLPTTQMLWVSKEQGSSR
jgi:hypothetical protein